jgi:hypothetical protein
MSEQEAKFIILLKKWVIGGVASIISLMLVSMFWFYTSANGRLKALEKAQSEKVDISDFKSYQKYQDLKDNHINQTLTEIKLDVKDIKNSL